MNALTPISPAQSLIRHYAEVRARLWGRPTQVVGPVIAARQPNPVVVDEPAPSLPDLGELSLVGIPGWQQLTLLAALRWGVTRAEMMGDRRDAVVMAAKQHAWWLIATHTGANCGAIGQRFGREHSTVSGGIAQHEKRIAGKAPMPFAWTDNLVAEFRGLVVDEDLTYEAAARRMGVPRREVKRIPGRAEIYRDQQRARRARYLAKRAGEAA